MSQAAGSAEPKKITVRKGKKVSLPEITVTFEEVTPETAGKWLEVNPGNRNIKESKVDAFARDIREGFFQTTHQGVAFNDKGELIDGQHRLEAIIRANTPVVMQVTRGLKDEVKPTIDTGTKRTVADTLRIEGFENRNIMGSIARMVMLYEAETPMSGYSRAATVSEVVDFIRQHEDRMIEASKLAVRLRPAIPAQPTVIGSAFDIFSQIDHEAAGVFFNEIANMQTGGEGDPRVALFRRLNSMKTDRERLSNPLVLSMFIRAWNAWRTGQTLTKIAVDRVRNKKVLEAI